MPVKQISVSLENVPGKLSEVSDYLGDNGINIIALMIADTADISAVRFVPSDVEKAVNVLRTHGYSVKVTEVLAVEAPNHPGGLNAVLKPLKDRINELPLHLSRQRKRRFSSWVIGWKRRSRSENWVTCTTRSSIPFKYNRSASG
jgi:ACT domain-containing protein